MAVRVGINGFGRIGRNIMRAALGDKNIDFVAVNDLTSAHTLAHLLKYDSVLGNLHARVEAKEDTHRGRRRRVQGAVDARSGAAAVEGSRRRRRVRVDRPLHQSRRRGQAPRRRREEGRHHRAGEEARTSRVVLGVNDEQYDPAKHHIISNASCTTNCLAPLAKVLHQTFGIKKGWMTTIHSYTNDQQLLDLPHKDLRRARAAALSMIPTTTGAAVGGRRSAAGAEGQARRLLDARADAERVVRRPRGAPRTEGHRGGSECGVAGRRPTAR